MDGEKSAISDDCVELKMKLSAMNTTWRGRQHLSGEPPWIGGSPFKEIFGPA
jgi:hypothetical protein